MKRSVLVLCIHNSARSQMAEEYVRRQCGECFDVESAGVEPGSLNPRVIEVLDEDGIDIRAKVTRSVYDLHEQGRSFDDPSAATGSEEEKLAETRRIRNQIKEKVRLFCSHSCGD